MKQRYNYVKEHLKAAPYVFVIMLMILGLKECAAQDSTAIKLDNYKQLFINGTITSQEYEALRKQVLGIATPQTISEKQEIKIPDTLTYDEQVRANQMFKKGEADAHKNFKVGGIFGGTFAATLLGSPLIGLIPAIACSSSAPKEENFFNDNPNLFKDPNYMQGYKKEARREKKHAAWTAWGIATGLGVLTGVVTGVAVKVNSKRPQ